MRRLAAFALLAFATGASAADARSYAPLLDAFATAKDFSGVVLVAEGDRVVEERAFGSGDTSMRYNLASVGKVFTAVAAMQLVEAGKLDLDAKVGRYLPDYPNVRVRDEVTLRHLLTHTSGLGSYWTPAFFANRTTLLDVDDHFALFADESPAFEPGTQWRYSNVGYTILGRVIEVASGEDYYDYVQRRIFDVAGMEDTGFFDRDGRAERVVEANPEREIRGGPAGGGYGSARDLLRFTRALTSNRLVGAASVAQLLTPAPVPGAEAPVAGPVMGPPAPRERGLGFDANTVDGGVVYGHGGGSIRAATEIRVSRADDVTIVVLASVDPPVMQRPLIAGYRALAASGALRDLSKALPIPRMKPRPRAR